MSTRIIMKEVFGAKGPSQKFTEVQWNEQRSFGSVGVFEKNHTLGFKWCFAYTFVWELKPGVRTFVRFRGGGGGGVQVKLILFILLGFYKLLRWPLIAVKKIQVRARTTHNFLLCHIQATLLYYAVYHYVLVMVIDKVTVTLSKTLPLTITSKNDALKIFQR